MDSLLSAFGEPHLQRALLLCVLAGFTNGYVSAFIVLRKSALMVGSLSHSLLPGIAAAILVAGLTPQSAFLGALIAGLIVGLGSVLISRASRLGHETAMAVIFTSAFAGGIILMNYVPQQIELEHYLFGNILYASDSDLRTVFWVSALALVVLTALRRPMTVMLFEPTTASTLGIPVRALNYVLFGIVIVVLISTLQAVGCILALGLLVTPAATVYLLSDSPSALFWGGGLVGMGGAVAGLVLSHLLGVGTGSAIVLVLGILFVVALIFGPRYGWIARIRTRQL